MLAEYVLCATHSNHGETCVNAHLYGLLLAVPRLMEAVSSKGPSSSFPVLNSSVTMKLLRDYRTDRSGEFLDCICPSVASNPCGEIHGSVVYHVCHNNCRIPPSMSLSSEPLRIYIPSPVGPLTFLLQPRYPAKQFCGSLRSGRIWCPTYALYCSRLDSCHHQLFIQCQSSVAGQNNPLRLKSNPYLLIPASTLMTILNCSEYSFTPPASPAPIAIPFGPTGRRDIDCCRA